MKFTIHRGWIRNLLTGKDIFARKLVVEDEVLFSSAGLTVRVSAVAYSGSEVTLVDFTNYVRGRGYDDMTVEASTVELMAAADNGADALKMALYRIWQANTTL